MTYLVQMKILLLSISLFGQSAFGQQNLHLQETQQVSVFYSHLPPYEFVNDKNQASGLGVEHIKRYFSARKHRVDFQYFSVARGVEKLNRGNVDFSTTISPKDNIRNNYWVSEAPLYQIQLGVFRRNNTNKINDVADLPALSLVSLRNTKFHFLAATADAIKQSATHYEVNEFRVAANLVKSNKMDYFLAYYNPQLHAMFLDLTFDSLMTLPVYLILSKSNPNAESLKRLLH